MVREEVLMVEVTRSEWSRVDIEDRLRKCQAAFGFESYASVAAQFVDQLGPEPDDFLDWGLLRAAVRLAGAPEDSPSLR
jgi:hypothetical protein